MMQKISLAPLAYYWSRQETLSFYADAADWPVESVYLGEVVCSRRHQMKAEDWLAVGAELHQAGKEVVYSTLTLMESEADRRVMHRLIERASETGGLIEANDYSAVRAMQGHPFVAGPHLNVYHADTLSWLRTLGCVRFLPPLEMPREDLACLQAGRPEGMQTEVQVWGRMALAFSSRCFTARHYRLHKDSCEFRCELHPDGLPLKTREHERFLNINGIQTQGAHCLDLGAQLPELVQMEVEMVRIQPQYRHTAEIVAAFDQARRAGTTAQVPEHCLPAEAGRSNGYWTGQPGMHWLAHETQ